MTTFTLDRPVVVELAGIETGAIPVVFFALVLPVAATVAERDHGRHRVARVLPIAIGIVGPALLVVGGRVLELVAAAAIRYYGGDVSSPSLSGWRASCCPAPS